MTDPATQHRRGCLFYGIIAFSGLLLLILIGAIAGLSYAKRVLNEFTDSRPMALPTVNMSQAQIDQIQERVAAFQQSIRQDHPTPPLALTADEINALIATTTYLEPLKGKVHVLVEGDQLKALTSVPLADVGLPVFKNRYLNGTVTLNVSFRDGVLGVFPETILVKGKPLPGVYMQKIRKENLVRNLENNPRTALALERLQAIQVKDGKLVIVPKTE